VGERVEGDHAPAVRDPPLEPTEERGGDPVQPEEHGDRDEDRERLRALAQGPDEPRLDLAGHTADGEVHREFREEDTDAEQAEQEREEQRANPRDDPGPEPLPGQRPDPPPEGAEGFRHAHARRPARNRMNVCQRRRPISSSAPGR